jgi:transcriptional regulator with XRE-family HTH domain
MAISDVLKQMREAADLQQHHIADRTGIQTSRLSRIENGRVEPSKEEIVTILQAIGTEGSVALAQDLERPLTQLTAPTWAELPDDDRRSISEADAALENLHRFMSRKDFPQHLNQFTSDLRDRLLASARLLINNDYTLYFVGPIGVGKTTAINSLFHLTGEFKKPRRKGKADFQTTQGLLPTGTGRTTAFEYRVVVGPEVGIRIDPQSDEEILRDVHSLCEYWLERVKGANPQRAVSEETEKVCRNMANLTETEDGHDPLVAMIRPDMALDDLVFAFRQRLDLPSRTQTELQFTTDREGEQTEGEWIQKRCRQLNFGLKRECPLPRRLTLVLPNPALKADGFHFTVIDTRGIDETALRRDVTDPFDDPRGVTVLCSRFFDAPTERVQQLIEHARKSGSSALPGRRVVMVVLPYHDEAQNVTLQTGEQAGTREQGYRVRQRQVEKALAEDAAKVKLLFFDAVADDSDFIRSELLAQIRVVRGIEHAKIKSLAEAVESLLDDQEKVQFAETQKRVSQKLKYVAQKYGEVDDLARPTYTRLVAELRGIHHSSLWSVTRNEGYGRSVNMYHMFGLLVRQDTKTRTDEAVHGLKHSLEELASDPEMKRSDMRRSKKYIAELLEGATLKRTEFLKQAQAIGEATLQPFIEKNQKLWAACLAERGQGPRYRERVAAVLEKWFDDHREVNRKLERRIQEAWDDIFITWLNGYTA